MSYWKFIQQIYRNTLTSLMKLFGMRKIANKLAEGLKVKQAEKSGYVPEPTPGNKKCNYHSCKKSLKGLTYHCKYCGGDYCAKHRLPEDHDCESPKLPREMSLGWGNKQLSSSRFSEALGERELN